jgi:Tol biopolymer transport system component
LKKTITLLLTAVLAASASLGGLTTALATTSPCAITQVTSLGSGGMADWSAATNLIAYSSKDASGTYQLHTVQPDGTGDVCLTCTAVSGGPAVNRHKVGAVWSADGKWIVVAVEDPRYPLMYWRTTDWATELIINGTSTDLYAVSADGQVWSQLTHYSNNAPGQPGYAQGVMSPDFSDDGTTLTWSKMVGSASGTAPYGTYRLMSANFSIGANGLPTLQNTQDITPATATPFVEAHNSSPDGTQVLYTSYASPTSPNNMDVFVLDQSTGTTTQLTTSPLWDEHASFSPSGAKIAYMAGQLGVGPMTADIMIMNPDGSNKQRLTAFNVKGQPGYTGQYGMVMSPSWNATGTAIVVTEQMAVGYPGARFTYVVSFAGACGS